MKIHSNILKHTELITNSCEENRGFYLSVEDARLIAGKIERLDVLYEMGVRFLIPMWSGKSCIGGAFDSDEGLTDFGKEVIKRCFDIGIIPDISHASIKSANDIFNIAEGVRKPVIASHSCSFAAYHHARNLRDDQFERIKSLGGIVGLSFCRYHLTNKNDKCNTDNILAHLEHYLEIGGEDTVCFGADMDGAPMPDDIKGIESVPMLYEKLCDRFGRAVSDKITYQNAYNFVKLNLK